MPAVDAELHAAVATVEARLGRPAQDELEAAVVLEAWAGVPATRALVLGCEVARSAGRAAAGGGRRIAPRSQRDGSAWAEGLALILAVVSVAMWATPMSDQLGPAVVEHALRIGLPLTLGLQWLLRSRYLSRPDGLAWLRAEGPRLVVGLLAAAAAPGLVAGPSGLLAGLLIVAWVSGSVLVRGGSALGYGVLLTAGAVALHAGVDAVLAVGAVAATTLGVVGFVVVRSGPREGPPGAFGRATVAAAVGLTLGILLVSDNSLGWGVHGAYPALGLVPSTLGSWWAGHYLWRFHSVVPRALDAMSHADADRRWMGSAATRVVMSALWRLTVGTVAASVLLLALSPVLGGTDHGIVFVAFGAVAVASVLANLLESLGFRAAALSAVATGVAAELATQLWLDFPPPGLPLTLGAAVAAAVAGQALLVQLSRPGRVVATRLWIT